MSKLFDYINKRLNYNRMEKLGHFGNRKRRTDNPLVQAVDKSKPLGVVMLGVLWLVCSVLLTLPEVRFKSSEVQLNQIANRTVFAECDFEYEDVPATAQAREAAYENQPTYYNMIDFENGRIRQNLLLVKKILQEYNPSLLLITPESGKNASPEVLASDRTMTEKAVKFAGTLNDRAFYLLRSNLESESFSNNLINELNKLLSGGVFTQEEKGNFKFGQQIRIIDSAKRIRLARSAIEIMTPRTLAPRLAEIMIQYYPLENIEDQAILRQGLTDLIICAVDDRGNLELNYEATRKARDEAVAAIKPIMREVKKNEPIVHKGDKMDELVKEKLLAHQKSYLAQADRSNLLQISFQNALCSLILIVFVGLYMYHIHPDIVKSNQNIALTGVVIILSLLINYGAMEVFNFMSPLFGLNPLLINNMIPYTLPSVVLAAILGFRVALYVGFFVAAISSMMIGGNIEVALEGMVMCSLAALLVRNTTNYRTFFLRTLFIIPLGMIILNFSVLGIMAHELNFLAWIAVLSFFNGVFTAIFALLLVILMEFCFHVSTNMFLMMLCDYNHPLLKKLQVDAPGTFHHSLMVSTLAEYAAQEIKANPIKARVGALFHDIGKLEHPEYYTENNLGNETNQHVALQPQISSVIIRSHVKDGVDLAYKFKLRKVIRDCIQQHHGTDMVSFFYRRALDEARLKGGNINESQFRYPGPLPKSPEVVLVSLADACEAACRSLEKPTSAKIEALVGEILRKRLRDGQLDDAEISIADLAKIRDSFVKTLIIINHGRIAYPKDEKNEDDLFVRAAHDAEAGPKNDKKTDDQAD